MSEQSGEKTEDASSKKLEDAQKKGQIPRSQEVQTLFVLLAGTVALSFTAREMWSSLVGAQYVILGNLHDISITMDSLPRYVMIGAQELVGIVAPVSFAIMISGLLAGGIQSRFQTAPEAMEPNLDKLNPINGFKKIFSIKSAAPAALAFVKLAVIVSLAYGVVVEIIRDPIFFSIVHPARIAEFLATSALKLLFRIVLIMILIAGADYAYQFWRHREDLKMTKQEVKDESKNAEGDPQQKARQRRRRNSASQRKMLAEVPHADVIITNPTHLAVALRYDRNNMKAPKIVAKGARKFALKIREIAGQHQVPIMENKPLARAMYKHGKVGGEVPAQLYAAVAEVLAYVYRMNRYKYWRQGNGNR
jgi:flagellar biosynthetic protein FlhB